MRKLNVLMPDAYVCSVHDIDYERLKEQGISLLLFDNDNTLLTYNTEEVPEKVKALFQKLKDMGFEIWILSNGKPERVRKILSQLKVHGIAGAKKPMTSGAGFILKRSGKKADECCIIGDQFFTDVLCGNLTGACSILVRPISLFWDEKITRVKRPAERMLLRIFRMKPVKKEE